MATPAFATATTYGFTFTAPNANSEGTTTGSMTFAVAGTNLTATVSAWNVTPQVNGSTTTYKLTQATLGYYQGGLGVISTANDNLTTSQGSCGVGECNTHQVDNMGSTAGSKSYDFLRITFSSAVTLGSVGLNAYGLYNSALNSSTMDLDDDFSYGKGNVTLTNNTTMSSLSSLFQTNVGSNTADGFGGNGGANGSCQDGNADGVCQNNFTLSNSSAATAATASANWYLAASIGDNYGGDGKVDGFKLASANVYYTTGAVPEPKSWAMMLMGFGAIGIAMRRRSEPLALLLKH